MGVVYAGRDDQLDRLVAIKVLAPSLANDEFRQRFFHEVRTLAQLHHPCIVTIYEAGEHDGQLFYAMELVGNSTLEDALRAGRTFDWREVVSIGIDAAQALACLHRCGIIHRNVCPDNLIPSDNGRVKMIGFGMAKVFGAAASSDTAALLTVDYMAPEQADGSSITPRADLYCLGTTLFKLLTGRSPFAGRSIAKTLHNMRYEEAPRVRSLAPDVPEGLDELSARLLKKDPQERVSTAQVLEKQLQGLAESDH
jgi:serine/threonine-protein kinase